jgi:hypothetical protein
MKFLIFLLNREGVNLCFHERVCWHTLFYNLKYASNPEIPSVLRDLFFEWNGPFPVCREVDEYLDGFRVTGCVESASPDFRKFWLLEGIAKLWSREYDSLSEAQRRFLEKVVLKSARAEFMKIAVQ